MSESTRALAACEAPRKPPKTKKDFTRPERIDPNQIYSLEETCAAIDVSRAQAYRLMAANKLKKVNFDGRVRFAGAEIIRFTGGVAI